MLDGKQITDNSRKFLMSWKASREAQHTKEKPRVDTIDGLGDYPSQGRECSINRFRIQLLRTD